MCSLCCVCQMDISQHPLVAHLRNSVLGVQLLPNKEDVATDILIAECIKVDNTSLLCGLGIFALVRQQVSLQDALQQCLREIEALLVFLIGTECARVHGVQFGLDLNFVGAQNDIVGGAFALAIDAAKAVGHRDHLANSLHHQRESLTDQ